MSDKIIAELDGTQKATLPEKTVELQPDMILMKKENASLTMKRFLEFTEISGIPGLAFIRPNTSRLETAFWLIVTLFASVLTIRDLVAQIRQFQEEPIITTSRFVDALGGEGFSFSTPTLCLEINPHQLDHWIRGFENGSRLNEIFARLSDEFRQNSSESVKCILNSTTDIECAKSIQSREEYFGLLGYSIRTIMSLVNTYSKRSSMNEEVLQRKAEFEWARVFIAQEPGGEPFDVEKQSRIVETYLHYMHMNVSLLQLLRNVASALCHQMEVVIRFVQLGIGKQFENTTILPDICAPETITWLGFSPRDGPPDMVCLRLPSLTFRSASDYVVITLNIRRVFSPDDWPDVPYIAEMGSMHLALPYRYQTIGTQAKRTLQAFYSRKIAAFLSVQTEFNEYSRMDHQCGDPSIDPPALISPDCKHYCALEVYLSNCKCWPLSGLAFRDGWPELREKHGNISTICGEVSAEVAEREYERIKIPHFSDLRCADALRQQEIAGGECLKGCLVHCKRQVFQATVYEMPTMFTNIRFDADSSALLLSFKSFEYISIEEQPRLEFSNVMTNIGGILGLWLGTCFVTIAYIPVYAIKLLFDFMREKVSQLLEPISTHL